LKFVLIFFFGFIFLSMLMGSARKRGKLNDEASRAVGALANAMRFFVYGLLVLVVLACGVAAYQML
jgi:ABC-type dipeptide/oligopeptide/nickel transport system permease component